MTKILAVIPARGGSKGLPGKNIKLLNGKPLICYSIDTARELLTDQDICVSTDDPSIIRIVEDYGLTVPFRRPDELATDMATTNDVLLHALRFYEMQGILYDVVLLLQPTSPLRTGLHLTEALALYRDGVDMVVSVICSHAATVLCQENEDGFLEFTLNKQGKRRQDIPDYYEYNGAIYIIDARALRHKGLANLSRRIKYVMSKTVSVDIDDELDFLLIENIMKLNN